MTNQKGFFTLPFTTPSWLIYGLLAIGAIISLVAIYNVIDGRGYTRGQSEERTKWQQRENRELREANAKILEITEKYRALERSNQDHMRAIEEQHQVEVKNETEKRDRVITDLRKRGSVRVSSNIATCVESSGAGVPTTSPGVGSAQATREAQLSGPAAEFLVREASRADRITLKLNKVQEALLACEAIGGVPR